MTGKANSNRLAARVRSFDVVLGAEPPLKMTSCQQPAEPANVEAIDQVTSFVSLADTKLAVDLDCARRPFSGPVFETVVKQLPR